MSTFKTSSTCDLWLVCDIVLSTSSSKILKFKDLDFRIVDPQPFSEIVKRKKDQINDQKTIINMIIKIDISINYDPGSSIL